MTIRELRNHGGAVVDRVARGERLVVTRDGTPVAELHPLARRGPDASTLLERWRRVPAVDPVAFRRDVDELIDPAL